MSLSRMLSLIIAAVAAAAVTLLLSVGPAAGLPLTVHSLTGMLLASLAVGGAVGLTAWFILRALVGAPVDRLTRQIETDVQRAVELFTPPTWLIALHRAIAAAVGQFRGEMEQLNSRRRELEVSLRVAQGERQNMEAIVQSIADAVLVTDAFNEVLLCNAAAADALSFSLAQARRQPVERVVHDPLLVKLIKDMRESGSTKPRRHLEHRLQQPGRTRTYDVTLACIPNAQGEVTGVVTILRDITREKQIAELQSDFVSGVSHELRTPLSSIKAYVEMLVDGEIDDEKTRAEFYNIIQSETNRLSRLIDNVLNINRIESGIVRVQREDVDLNRVLREAVEFMQPQARAKQITLTEHTPGVALRLYADRDMIHQVLLNLISNAIKYTPDGGAVSVDTRLDEALREVVIDVTDNGVGIPPEAMPHLFEKFFRVADHKKMAKGTGLGLNLVKHIVEKVHYGRVSVESGVGRGSRFSIRLPLSECSGATNNRKLERSRA